MAQFWLLLEEFLKGLFPVARQHFPLRDCLTEAAESPVLVFSFDRPTAVGICVHIVTALPPS